MTGLAKNWKTDPAKENDGVPFEYEQNDDGSTPTIWVRRNSSTAHIKAQNKVFEKFRAEQRLKIIPVEKSQELSRKVFAMGCISNWQNVQDEHGKEIPFTEENAVALMESMPDLYYDLVSKSNEKDNYKADILEQLAGN